MIHQYAVLWLVTTVLLQSRLSMSEYEHFLNEWVAEIAGGLNQVQSITARYGFEVIEPMPHFADHYILMHVRVAHRSKRSADHHTWRLTGDPSVTWAQQQQVRRRDKRDRQGDEDTGLSFNDPHFPNQWYIVDQNRSQSHIQAAWSQGWSGKGVVITILDDGLEHNNTDIEPNYDQEASFDLNDNDPDPMPSYDANDSQRHGTRCAGEVGMAANNSVCGVGVAFNCNLGGVRFLDGQVTDRLEAMALSFNHTYIDIYSMSWGPADDGMTLDGPGKLAAQALEKGIHSGRGGKGVIYVQASGNGGMDMDNCNYDGYVSSIYTVSVSAVSQSGKKPWYGELCSSTLTTSYSSSTSSEKKIVSTDIYNGCTDQHSGTSASAPLVAGIIALALEANPSLTWRDVQHLVALSSKARPLADNKGWYQNAAGFCVNLAFGFGLLDAQDLVLRAQSWQLVPEQSVCEATSDRRAERSVLPKDLASGGDVLVTLDTDGCRGQQNEVNYLEHVQFVFTMNYTYRGALSVMATSPSGTQTKLLLRRTRDNSTENFNQWPLMTVHTWGETPAGAWTFRVIDNGEDGLNSGVLVDVKLIMYGTKMAPDYRSDPTSVHCDPKVLLTNSTKDEDEPLPASSPTSEPEDLLGTSIADNQSSGAEPNTL